MELNVKLQTVITQKRIHPFLAKFCHLQDDHSVDLEIVQLEEEEVTRISIHLTDACTNQIWMSGISDNGEGAQDGHNRKVKTLGPRTRISMGKVRELYTALLRGRCIRNFPEVPYMMIQFRLEEPQGRIFYGDFNGKHDGSGNYPITSLEPLK